jgi:aminoglycoside 3-N-acetyltransferase
MVKQILRGLRNEVRHGIKRAKHRLSSPALDEAAILAALTRLPALSTGVVFVHSSLSACGYVDGGAGTVIRALRQWTSGSTLTMPVHSYCYPSGQQAAPVFDPAATPSVVGAVTDAFWRQPGVKRSLHPTHSIAALGAAADDIVRDHHTCDTPCGQGTPYERLVLADAAVLMFGASLDAYTLFHTAEDQAAVPYLYEAAPVTLAYREADGSSRTMTMWKQDMDVARSFREKDAWLERLGLLQRVTLGAGELMLMPHARRVHDAIVAELRRDPAFLRAA